MNANLIYFDLKSFKILKWDSRTTGHWNCLKDPNNSTRWLTPAFKGCVLAVRALLLSTSFLVILTRIRMEHHGPKAEAAPTGYESLLKGLHHTGLKPGPPPNPLPARPLYRSACNLFPQVTSPCFSTTVSKDTNCRRLLCSHSLASIRQS